MRVSDNCRRADSGRQTDASLKVEFHDADTDTDILARILADTFDARFTEAIPMASSTTRRHSRDDPREDVGEEVRVGVRVGAVERQLHTVVDGRTCLCESRSMLAPFTSTMRSPSRSPATSAGDRASTRPMYWPRRPRSACMLKPKPRPSFHDLTWHRRARRSTAAAATTVVESATNSASTRWVRSTLAKSKG